MQISNGRQGAVGEQDFEHRALKLWLLREIDFLKPRTARPAPWRPVPRAAAPVPAGRRQTPPCSLLLLLLLLLPLAICPSQAGLLSDLHG